MNTKNILYVVVSSCAVVILMLLFVCPDEGVRTQQITVGVLAPFTGARADAGSYMRNALILAAEEINAHTENAYNIDFVYADTQYKASVAVSAAQKLINLDGVEYLIGPYGSSQVLAVAPIAEDSHTILITPGSQSDEVSQSGEYIFRNIHNTAQEAPVFAEFAASQMQGDTLHFLAINTAFTDSYLKYFTPALEGHGKKMGIVERFEPTDSDFRTQLTKLKAENPTDIFPIATPKHMGMILVQADELGIDSNMYHIGVEGPDLVEIAGELAEGIYYPYSYDNSSEQESVRSFVEKYTVRFGVAPDTVAANAYDAAHLLSRCFEEVGTEVDAVKQCLYDVENNEGAGGTFSFDVNGDATKPIIIKTVKDGEFVVVEG